MRELSFWFQINGRDTPISIVAASFNSAKSMWDFFLFTFKALKGAIFLVSASLKHFSIVSYFFQILVLRNLQWLLLSAAPQRLQHLTICFAFLFAFFFLFPLQKAQWFLGLNYGLRLVILISWHPRYHQLPTEFPLGLCPRLKPDLCIS